MGRFLESEKPKQIRFKANTDTISEKAKVDGIFKGIPRPFCLPSEFAEENLYPSIRKAAMAFFAKHGIGWHQGQGGKPSSHLCSSQVACINFLFPFSNRPEELGNLLRPIFPQLLRMLPVEDGLYVSFEWIGEKNYLGERVTKNGTRTRGANCTSADAIVMFEDKDHKREAVLIEWKYTESYGGNYLGIADSGTDRRKIYQHLFDELDCIVDKELLPSFDALYFEPFYQFMRQQFLAAKMEEAHELGADMVRLLHISPDANYDFKKNTSPLLSGLGETPTEIWKRLVKKEGRFLAVHTVDLFMGFRTEEMQGWKEYMGERYGGGKGS
jgi:hypothetical protein